MNTLNELINLFSSSEISPEKINELFLSNNTSLKYPGLCDILFLNHKYDCLNTHLSNLQNENYLIIHFFNGKINIPSELCEFVKPYVDNLLAISLDSLKLENFIQLNEQFPNSIGEHTILKLIKIYDTKQNHFFNIPLFDDIENIIVKSFDKLDDKDYIVEKIEEHLLLLPLYLKLAQQCEEPKSLKFLDKSFKQYLPSYMENYIEKLHLNRKLNENLKEKKVSKTNLKI